MEDHQSFIKTPKQFVIVILLSFAIPITIVALLSQLVTGFGPEKSDQSEAAILDRIKPVGQVILAAAGPTKSDMTGEQVYQAVCKTCHEGGIAGAPKFGDKAAWGPHIKMGVEHLFTNALQGTDRGMPPKGGNADLSDVEVQRAVVFMANHSGATFKEPPAPAAAPAGAAAPVAAAAAAAPPAAASAAPAAKPGAPLDMASGTAMMQKDGCSACHAVDKKIVGPAYEDVAAKYKGEKDAAAKLAQKVKAGGSGVWGQIPMPPNAAVPDEDVKALVAWILTLKK
ncbi:MAG TPA: c-type cytochrome [Casimicrobiaceae bacterium]|nr:c-type cytochrome [Casimicrobiaceae bacterium]